MTVARLPGRKPAKDKDAAADRFIEGAAVSAQVVLPTVESTLGGNKTPVMMRFDPALLARVDRAAKRRGISRSGWIAYTVSKALDEEG